MNETDAGTMHIGDIVRYNSRVARINSIIIRGIAAPYFRLSDVETGEAIENGQQISHRLCTREEK